MSFIGLLNVSPVDLFFSLSMGFAVVLISSYFLTDFGCNYTYFVGFYKMEKFRLTIHSFFFFELESHVAKVGPELALQKRMAFNLFCPASPTQILKLLLLFSARLLNFKCFYFLHFFIYAQTCLDFSVKHCFYNFGSVRFSFQFSSNL